MIKLSEHLADEIRCLTITRETGETSNYVGNGYDLFKSVISSGKHFEEVLSTKEILSYKPQRTVEHFFPPFITDCKSMTTVSSFGNTHEKINDRYFTKKPLDWFYKGCGDTLKMLDSGLVLPLQSYGGGIEVEYALVFMVDLHGLPIVIGYTLALDFSDVIMRHRHPSLAAISKLSDTFVSKDIIISNCIPIESKVTCIISNNGVEKWQASGKLGVKNMKFSLDQLLQYFSTTKLLQPNTVHYLLLGAAISTNKGGYSIEHGDIINVESQFENLSISCRYTEDAVTFACI